MTSVHKVRPLGDEFELNERDNAQLGRTLQIRKLFQRATMDTTIHGIRYIFETDTILLRRVLWIIVFLLSAGFWGQQLQTRITVFLSNPQSVNLEIVYPETIRFPDVTFCNHNAFKRTHMDLDHLEAAKVLFQVLRHATPVTIQAAVDFEAKWIMKYGRKFNLTDTYLNGRHYIEDMAMSICTFNDIPCSYKNFTLVINNYGPCYKFIGDGSGFTVSTAGVDSGLKVVMNAEQYAYALGQRTSVGVQVGFSSPEDIPAMGGYGVTAVPGGATFIGIDVLITEELPRPLGECDSLPLKYSKIYSKSACFLECLSNYINERCGCRGFALLGDLPSCGLVEDLTCSIPLSKNFSESAESKKCNCPVACFKVDYTPTMMYAPIANNVAQEMAANPEFFTNPNYVNGMLNEILKSTDLAIIQNNASLTALDLKMLVDSFGAHLADYIDEAKVFYPMADQLSKAADSILSNSSQITSQQRSALAQIREQVGNLSALIQGIDTSRYQPQLFRSNSSTQIQQVTNFFFVNLLGYLGRTMTFQELSPNSSNGTALLALKQTLVPTSQQILSNVEALKNALSSTLPLGHILNELSSSATLLSASANRIQEIVLNMLIGVNRITQYAQQTTKPVDRSVFTPRLIWDNFIRVEIFLKDLRYTKVTKQTTDSLVSLVCDIGGSFGLCLGASVMSIYELFDLVICLLFVRAGNR